MLLLSRPPEIHASFTCGLDWIGLVAVTLNQHAYDNARRLIDEGAYVIDDRDMWSEHQPSAAQEKPQLDVSRIRRPAR
jgi:hypothetical protein